ncbi:LCP family protein [Lentibacillus sediminis]|uniref:LCP family protein n=1 Tax=Lentibacillus sediminis TaxID=1940529 RepID=UPI000C1BBFC5|nr:LCP family protein [Lentibacillus sediminis]
MSNQKTTQTRVLRRKRRRLRKRAFLILIPLALLLAVVSYGGYLYIKADNVLSNSYVDDGREKSELRETAVDPSSDNVSILIMGVDASDIRNNADNARTDTLMVATLNIEEKSVKLVSIPRDSLVYIPEVGYETKINHAHAYGGTEASINTVENLLDIPIDYFVKLNFEAFIDVVNAVDGITVDVPYELYEQNSKDQARAIHLMPGEQQLNGEEALALARTRKLDNDIARGKRQQEIIKAVVDKAVSLNSVLKYDDIIEAVGSNMTTNMTFSEMRSFIGYGTQGSNLDFEMLTLDGTDYQPGNTYYWLLDEYALSETKQLLQNHLGVSGTTTASDTGETSTSSGDGTNAY